MAQAGRPGIVGLDRLDYERLQGRLELVGRFMDANDVAVVRGQCLSDLIFECVNSHEGRLSLHRQK